MRLSRYEQLEAAGGVAPAQWKFDNTDWWLEEHGLIMEQPEFPLQRESAARAQPAIAPPWRLLPYRRQETSDD